VNQGKALALAAVTAVALPASAMQAGDAVAVPGRLSDADFYRLVSCAAPPGGECTKPVLRWSAERPIRVALRQIDPAYLGRRKHRAEAALTRALQALNAADAGFRLARVGPTDRAEIAVYFLDLETGDTIAGTGIEGVDGAEIGATATRLQIEPDSERIRGAAIVVSTSLETSAFEAAMLKQMTRAMGLMTELDAPAYAGLSALAYATHTLTHLGLQDIAALRRHYAAPAR